MKRLRIIATATVVVILLLQSISIALAWELERPQGDYFLNQREENMTTNGEASVGLGVDISAYNDIIGTPY